MTAWEVLERLTLALVVTLAWGHRARDLVRLVDGVRDLPSEAT
jgi:hypothetical protein